MNPFLMKVIGAVLMGAGAGLIFRGKTEKPAAKPDKKPDTLAPKKKPGNTEREQGPAPGTENADKDDDTGGDNVDIDRPGHVDDLAEDEPGAGE